MKKLLVLIFSVLTFVLVFTAAGCGKANTTVENSLKYDINTTLRYLDEIDGSFQIEVNSGVVTNVSFTVKGYDKSGNELWSRKFDQYYNGLEAQKDPHKISFSYSYYFYSYDGTEFDKKDRTNSIAVYDVKIKKAPSNEWMGWTFGSVSAACTLVVITLFVLSKIKPEKETSLENHQ